MDIIQRVHVTMVLLVLIVGTISFLVLLVLLLEQSLQELLRRLSLLQRFSLVLLLLHTLATPTQEIDLLYPIHCIRIQENLVKLTCNCINRFLRNKSKHSEKYIVERNILQ